MTLRHSLVFTLLVIVTLLLSHQTRAATWKSSLNFGSDFERDWARNNNDQPKPEMGRGIAKESLRGIVDNEPVNQGKLASKNCFFSPVQCSFFYKRSYQYK